MKWPFGRPAGDPSPGNAESAGADAEPFDAAFLASLSRLSFAVRRMRAREGQGVKRSDRRGGRVEFADHRPYAPGDDPRTLDWAAYARTHRLVVKEYTRDEELALLVLLDCSASMGTGGKFLAAQRLAYALAFLGLADSDRVRLGFLRGDSIELTADVAGTPRIRSLGRAIAAQRAAGQTDLSRALRGIPAARRGTRVVVLLSDLLCAGDGRRELARRRQVGDEVSVLQVWSPRDLDALDSGGGGAGDGAALWLVDAETGERRPAPVDAARLARDALGAREEDWRHFSLTNGLHFVAIDATASTEEHALGWLRAGGVLR